MSYRLRTVLGVIVIEALLFGFFLYTADAPGDTAERARIMFGIMGAILGISPVLFLLAWRNDKRKSAGK